jgi:hypothetical protein
MSARYARLLLPRTAAEIPPSPGGARGMRFLSLPVARGAGPTRTPAADLGIRPGGRPPHNRRTCGAT